MPRWKPDRSPTPNRQIPPRYGSPNPLRASRPRGQSGKKGIHTIFISQALPYHATEQARSLGKGKLN